jgi:AhpD family alkylhydroperoxidase
MGGGKSMNRTQVYQEMESTFGFVPTMFKTVPDTTLELEWQTFKRTQLEENLIPAKYKELMGLVVSAVGKCRYCMFYHTEMARLHGATDAEIEEALRFTKTSIGWSAYISGLQMDFEQFKQEIQRACAYVSAHKKPQPAGVR